MEEISSLSAGEIDWIKRHVDLLGSYGVDLSEIESLDAMYSKQLQSWLATMPDERPDANPFINLLGIGLGEFLVRTTKLEWRLLSDEQGMELAVNLPETSLLMFPVNAVGKRWISGEPSFMVAYVTEANAALDRLAGEVD